MGKGTTTSGKPTGAPRATGPDEARRTTRGQQACQRGTSPATTKTHGQVPSNNGQRVPQTRAARTTRKEARHRTRCHATPNPDTAHPSKEWRGTSRARTQAHTRPDTPARSGGAQPTPQAKHTHPRHTPQPGVAGYKGSAHENAHTPQHPGQDWPGTVETRGEAHTPTQHTPPKSGGVQEERARKGTNTAAAQPGVAGHSQKPSPRTHTRTVHLSQEWRGRSGVRTRAHTHQHPSKGGQGAGEIRAQAHTPTQHNPARNDRVQAERAYAHPNTPARSGGAQPKPESKRTHPNRTPQPGVAGHRRSAHMNTHTAQHPARSGAAQRKPEPRHTHHAAYPSQEWGRTSGARTQRHTTQHPSQERRGAAKTRAETHTPTPHSLARSGGVQAEQAHKHTHTPKPQPGVAGRDRNPSLSTHHHHTPQPGEAGYKRSAHTHTSKPQPRMVGRSQNSSPSTHANTAHPSQEWRGTSGARTRTHTHPSTPARSGGAQSRPDPKDKHPRRTPQPQVAGYKQSAYTKTHTPTPQLGEAGRS